MYADVKVSQFGWELLMHKLRSLQHIKLFCYLTSFLMSGMMCMWEKKSIMKCTQSVCFSYISNWMF